MQKTSSVGNWCAGQASHQIESRGTMESSPEQPTHQGGTSHFISTSAVSALLSFLCLGCIVFLAGCDGNRRTGSDRSVPKPQQKMNMLSFAFDGSAVAALSTLPHDSIEARVTSSSGSFEPLTSRFEGRLREGRVLIIPSVPRLGDVVVVLNVMNDGELVTQCVSDELDLQNKHAPSVRVSLTCADVQTPELTPVVITPEIYVNPTVDLDLIYSAEQRRSRFFDRVSNGGVVFRTQASWAGTSAVLELLLVQESRITDGTPAMSLGHSVLSAVFKVSEASSSSMLLRARAQVSVSDWAQALRTAGTVHLKGVMNGPVQNGSAVSTQVVPVSLQLHTRQLFEVLSHEEKPTSAEATTEFGEVSQAAVKTNSLSRFGLRVAFQGHVQASAADMKNIVDQTTPHLIALTETTLLEAAERPSNGHIRIASYNVENFWDDIEGNTAAELTYDDYAAARSNYVQAGMPALKARQVALALSLAGSPDIVGFQELESAENSGRSLDILSEPLRKQGYSYFAVGRQSDDKPVSVTTGIASRYPIVLNESLRLDYHPEGLSEKDVAMLRLSARDPQVVEVLLPGKTIVRIYNSHWKSKRGDLALSEGMREAFGRLIAEDISKVRKKRPLLDIVVMGDFNTDYTEHLLATGLGQTGDKRQMLLSKPADQLYNLWFDLPLRQRCSYSYSGQRTCIDHLLVTDTLYDTHGLQIIDGSFRAIGRNGGLAAQILLAADGTPFRWQTFTDFRNSTHLGVGFSDHLPLVADFRIMNSSSEPLRKLTRVELLPESFSTTPEAPVADLPDQVPACGLDEYTPVEQVGDLHLPQVWGKCVEMRAHGRADGRVSPYVIRRTGLFSVKTRLKNGQEIGLSTTRAFAQNQMFLRSILQKSSMDRVLVFRGRLGWANGVVSILADNPQLDVQLEPFEEPCLMANDATLSVSELASVEQARRRVGSCVGFQEQALVVDPESTSNKEQVKLSGTIAAGVAQIILKKEELESVTGELPESLAGTTLLLTGFSALTSVTEESLVFRSQFNGRQTGVILNAVKQKARELRAE